MSSKSKRVLTRLTIRDYPTILSLSVCNLLLIIDSISLFESVKTGREAKMKCVKLLIITAGITIWAGCKQEKTKMEKGTFGNDLKFLKKYTDVFVLSDKSGKSQVAVIPKYQGRIMTSTAEGGKGLSFGWLNRELIASDKFAEHINVFGGEDRFWLGPGGGRFSK